MRRLVVLLLVLFTACLFSLNAYAFTELEQMEIRALRAEIGHIDATLREMQLTYKDLMDQRKEKQALLDALVQKELTEKSPGEKENGK